MPLDTTANMAAKVKKPMKAQKMSIALAFATALVVPTGASLIVEDIPHGSPIGEPIRERFARLLEPVESEFTPDQRAAIEALILLLEEAEAKLSLALQSGQTLSNSGSFAAAVEGCTADYACGGSSTDSHDTYIYHSDYFVYGDEVDQTACADVVNMQNVAIGDNNWICVNVFIDNRFSCEVSPEGGSIRQSKTSDGAGYEGSCTPRPSGNSTLEKTPG